MGGATFLVNPDQPDAFTISVAGRNLWALECLRDNGETGCTPIDHPAPRWSAYVHRLREMGLVIETMTETHGGPFPGHHARYVLHSTFRNIERENER
tara:strand:- start:4944 stop:5234 length:291 start_codon:yes stop_codon:yes gene_type:complete